MNIGINQKLKQIANRNNTTIDIVMDEIQCAIAIARANPIQK